MFDFLRKYAKIIGYIIWIIVIAFVFNENQWDVVEVGKDIKRIFLGILSIPAKIWALILNLFNSLITLLTYMWETKSWEKAFKFLLIGIIKRFVIEDLFILPVIQYYVGEFKNSALIWWKIKWGEVIAASNKIKIVFYTILFAPILGIITYLEIGTLLGFMAQKLFLNKILSFIKTYLLKFIPWLFSLIIDSSTLIAVIIEYIIALQIVKMLLAIPYFGKLIILVFTKPVEWVKYLDTVLKKWILQYPHKYLTKWGIRENSLFQQWVLDRGYKNIEAAEKMLSDIEASKQADKPPSLFQRTRKKIKQAILNDKSKKD